MNVVLDTNVIISRYLSPRGTPAKIFDLWERNYFDVVVSEALLSEYQRVFRYPHLQAIHQLSEEDIAAILTHFREVALLVEPTEIVTAVQNDPDDNKFLACALASDAEYIVSGDQDLLTLATYRGIHIVTPGTFLTWLEQEKQVA